MPATATLQRRLIRTKEAATYLSMSDWKLRRLIQEGALPVVQEHEGGPFLLDLRDLDSYVETNKHSLAEDFPVRAKFSVVPASPHARSGSRRAE
jgi:excisionase family DNA binding protein